MVRRSNSAAAWRFDPRDAAPKAWFQKFLVATFFPVDPNAPFAPEMREEIPHVLTYEQQEGNVPERSSS